MYRHVQPHLLWQFTGVGLVKATWTLKKQFEVQYTRRAIMCYL